MKKLFIGLMAGMAILLAGQPAQAIGPFQFGVKGGVNLQELTIKDAPRSFDDAKNLMLNKRCGWQAGVTAQFTLPVLGLGAEASALYSRRTSETPDGHELNNDFISVPIHAIYKLDLPMVGNVIAPYIFAGPDFAFRLNKDDLQYTILKSIATNGESLQGDVMDQVTRTYMSKKYNVSLDFGLGVELMQHLQVSACYTIGMNSAMKYYEVGKMIYDANQGNPITIPSGDPQNWEGDSSIQNTGWSVSVAYLF